MRPESKSLTWPRLPARLLARLASLAAVVVVLASPATVHADEAAARAHFKKGIELYDKKHYAEALTAFQDAYREKPSAGIKQNIALSLKGLGRLAEAATAFDEALDEGKGTLKPETRAAMERELAELSKSVATVNLTVVTAAERPEDRKPVDDVTISILPAAPAGAKAQPLPAGAHRRPIRLMPGIYTFSAHAAGYADPPEKKFALVSGAPVDATFVMGAQGGQGGAATALGPNEGMLKVQTNAPDATVRIDTVELPQRGGFSGKVSAGVHKVEISSPGWRTTTLDVTVPAGATVEQPVKLQAIGEAPPEYVAPTIKVAKPKKFYLAASAALEGVSYRLGVPLDEPAPYGSRRGFGGLALGGRAGYMVTRTFAVEGLFEFGAVAAKYQLRPDDDVDTRTSVGHWQLTPMLRFMTPGKIRFTAATGFGVHGLVVESKVAQRGNTLTKNGSGVGFSWLTDAGMQFGVGPLFLEVALFLNVHGVGAVRDDDPPEARFFYASPATRGGLRVGLVIPL
jgi:hypothetical protein